MSVHRYYLVATDDSFLPSHISGATVTFDGCSPAHIDLDLSDDAKKTDLDDAMESIGWRFFETLAPGAPRLAGFGGPNLVAAPFTFPVIGGDFAGTIAGTYTLPSLATVPIDKPLYPTRFKALAATGATVAPTGADTIDGAGSLGLGQFEAIVLLPDVANLRWLRFARQPPAGTPSVAQTSVSGLSQVFGSSVPTKITGASTFLEVGGAFDNGGANDLAIRYIGSATRNCLFAWSVRVREDPAGAGGDGTFVCELRKNGVVISTDTQFTSPVDAAHGGTAAGRFLTPASLNDEFELFGFRLTGGGDAAVQGVAFTAELY